MNAARASLLALLLCWASAALALVAVPPLSGRVVDQTGTLTAGDIASLTQALQDLETRKGSQVAVLIVPTTDGEAIEQYALRVAEAWKIGRKKIDDGALLVIAKNDRRLRIEVGYGLEGALTDATTKRIIDEDITPKFKTGDFGGGVAAGVDKMVRHRQWREAAGAGTAALAGFAIVQSRGSVQSVSHHSGDIFRRAVAEPAGTPAGLGGRRRADGPDCLVHGRLGHGGGDRRRDRVALCVDQRQFHVSRRRAVGVALAAGPEAQAAHGPAAAARAAAAASVAAAAASAAAAHRGAGSMSIRRIGRHLLEHRWRLRRILPPQALARIEQAIKAGEATHSGQVRFVVEGALDGAPLFRNQPARERALDIFSQLRIWDTIHNNGVLIYLLLADHDFEIIADRGIDAKVGHAGWEKICVEMETQFRAGNFEGGVIRGVEAVSRELATHFPRSGGGPNELPDAPVVM